MLFIYYVLEFLAILLVLLFNYVRTVLVEVDIGVGKKTSMGGMDFFLEPHIIKAVFTNSVDGTFLFDHSEKSNRAACKVFHLTNL